MKKGITLKLGIFVQEHVGDSRRLCVNQIIKLTEVEVVVGLDTNKNDCSYPDAGRFW